MRSIQTKILTVVISGLLIMTVATGAVSLYMTNRILHKDADTILRVMCGEETARINDVLGDVQKSVQFLCKFATDELESVDMLKTANTRDAYSKRVADMFGYIARSTEGVVTYYLRFNPELTTPTAGFFHCMNNGVVSVLPPTDLSAYPPSHNEYVGWYYIAVESGKAMWLSPYMNQNTGIEVVSYVVPLYKDGRLVGVAGMDIEYALLTETVDSITVYENGCAVLVDENGDTVYNAKGAHEHKKGAYAEAAETLSNGMQLVIRAGYDDIQSERYPLSNSLIVLSLIILCVFILLTVYLTRRIVRPLKKLVAAAETLAGGNVDVDLHSDLKDEIGTLSNVFQKTAERLKENMHHVSVLAFRDSLTGLENRTAYAEAASELDRKMQVAKPRFAILVADINNMKGVNDTFGHEIGNRMIIRTAKLLAGTFVNSSVYRIGGDEFVVILENKDYDDCSVLLEKLDLQCKTEFLTVSGTEIPVSIALGTAVYDHETDRSCESVFDRADRAMYLHKRSVKIGQ